MHFDPQEAFELMDLFFATDFGRKRFYVVMYFSGGRKQ